MTKEKDIKEIIIRDMSIETISKITLDDIEVETTKQTAPNRFMKFGIIIGVVLWMLDFCLGFMG